MPAPVISVVTVSYNDLAGLRKTVANVLSQSYTAVDYVVVDGGSTDGSVELLESHGARIRWVSERDGGIYDAMNKGLRMARGDYVIFMNAGDTFHGAETMAAAAAAISGTPQRPLVAYGAANLLTKDDVPVGVLQPLGLTRAKLNMFATRVVCHQAIFAARAIAPEYDTRFRLKAELDWYYALVERVPESSRLRLPLTVCDYRLGGRGEQRWLENQRERVAVTRKNNGIATFALSVPFFAVPLLFRVRNALRGLR